MNNEIKEILNRFDFVKKEPNKLSYYPEDLLTREEIWLLYDYITNLQEENDRHFKEAIRYENACDELEIRIDKAIEYGNNCLENLKDQENYISESIDIVNLLEMIHKNYIDIIQGSNK